MVTPNERPSWLVTLKFIKESAVDNQQIWELDKETLNEVVSLASDIACEAANAQLNKFNK